MYSGRTTTYQSDFALGKKSESTLLPKLRSFFKDDAITPTEDRYCIFDYQGGDGTKYEVKTRRIGKRTYPTSLMPCHKVISDSKQVFVLRFTDGDCYIEYDEDKFSRYEKKTTVDTRAGMNYKEQNHFLIPIADLIDF